MPDQGGQGGEGLAGAALASEAWMEVWKERRLGRDQEATNNPDVGGGI